MEIIAERLTPEHIIYRCPHCKTRYKMNGEPYKTAKEVYHAHGNDTKGRENRRVTRTHHAVEGCKNTFEEATIVIDNSTIKLGFNDW